ncbi:hypothetical protein CVT26_003493, partial [Gymnopilus dilepis]
DILDFVGLLPCLALLSLSAALTLGAFILSDPTEKEQALTWEMIFEALPCMAQKYKIRRLIDNKDAKRDSTSPQ